MNSCMRKRLPEALLILSVLVGAASLITCSRNTDPSGQPASANLPMTASPGPIDFEVISDSLQKLGMVVGAAYDQTHGRLNLIGNGEHPECSPSLQQIAVALRWAFADSARANFVSIDPWPSNPRAPWMTVRINRDAYDTEFGWIMFEADRLMKCYSMGRDNVTGATVASAVPGFLNMFQLILQQDTRASRQEVWSRFWFYPRQNAVESTAVAMRIGEALMGIRTETMRWQRGQLVPAGNLRDEAAEQFAAFFTEHYAKLADEEPIFRQLEQLMRLLLVSEWIRGNKMPVHLDWIEDFRAETFRMPRVTPALNVSQQESRQTGNAVAIQTIQLFGGVDLDVKPIYVPLRRGFPDWSTGIIRSATTAQNGVFDFQFDGRRYHGMAFPAGASSGIPRSPQPLIQLSAQNGNTILLRRRQAWRRKRLFSRRESEDLQEGWELALPRLYIVYPEGRLGQYEKFGIQGRPSSIVTVKHYELHDADGSLIGRFENHEIDQTQEKVVVKSTDANNQWQLYSQGDGVVWARGPGDRLLAFDGNYGGLVGEQFGDLLIRYERNRHGLLSRITPADQSQSIELTHGSNGHRYLSAKSSDGQQVGLMDPVMDLGRQTFTVYNELGQKYAVTLDSRNGNWTDRSGATPHELDFVDRWGMEMCRMRGRSSDEFYFASLISDGGLTHVVTDHDVCVFQIRTKDFRRMSHQAEQSAPAMRTVTNLDAARTTKQRQIVAAPDLDAAQNLAKVWGGQQAYFTSRAARAKANIKKIEANQKAGRSIPVLVHWESLKDKPPIRELFEKYRQEAQALENSDILVVLAHTTPEFESYLLSEVAPKASNKLVILLNCGEAEARHDMSRISEKLIEEHKAIGVVSSDRLLKAPEVDEVVQAMKELARDKKGVTRFESAF